MYRPQQCHSKRRDQHLTIVLLNHGHNQLNVVQLHQQLRNREFHQHNSSGDLR